MIDNYVSFGTFYRVSWSLKPKVLGLIINSYFPTLKEVEKFTENKNIEIYGSSHEESCLCLCISGDVKGVIKGCDTFIPFANPLVKPEDEWAKFVSKR